MNKKDPLNFQDCEGFINFDKSKGGVYCTYVCF